MGVFTPICLPASRFGDCAGAANAMLGHRNTGSGHIYTIDQQIRAVEPRGARKHKENIGTTERADQRIRPVEPRLQEGGREDRQIKEAGRGCEELLPEASPENLEIALKLFSEAGRHNSSPRQA